MVEQLQASPDFAGLVALAQTTVYDTLLIASVSTPTPAMLGTRVPVTLLHGEPAAPVLVTACHRLPLAWPQQPAAPARAPASPGRAAAMPGADLVVVPESHDHAVDPAGTVREVLARVG